VSKQFKPGSLPEAANAVVISKTRNEDPNTNMLHSNLIFLYQNNNKVIGERSMANLEKKPLSLRSAKLVKMVQLGDGM
jgi:hypothetical protein